MNAFRKACEVETRSREIVIPYLRLRSYKGGLVLTDKGRLARHLQQSVGDVLMNVSDDSCIAVELKAEKKNKHGNFFLEEWSNRSLFTRGWLDKLDSCFLLYHFIESDELYIIPFPKLRWWCFIARNSLGFPGRMYDFASKEQQEYDQPNDTWGRCVPIEVIMGEVGGDLRNPVDALRTERQFALFGDAK